MKRTLILLIIIATIGVLAINYINFTKQNTAYSTNKIKVSQNQSTATVNTFKKACEVFTKADADTLLGGTSLRTTGASDIVTANSSVTTCTYVLPVIGKTSNNFAMLEIRASDNTSSRTNFLKSKPSDAQDILDLGIEAYWNPTYKQLNLLKGQSWVIIASNSLFTSVAVAKVAIPKL